MKRLKELRQKAGYTQEQIAKMLRTTQQTVGRWETGKAKPSIAALRDLAVIYGTSVDDILGTNPLTLGEAIVSNALFISGTGEKERFWGHLGIRFPGQSKSTWYPITLAQTEKLDRFFANADTDNPWVTVRTLNNRLLLLNAMAVSRFVLLDDGADQPAGDWDLPWDGYAGFPQEVYKALSVWFDFDADNEVGEEYSVAFVETIEDIIREHQLDEECIRDLVDSTVIIRRDGIVERILSDRSLWDLVEEAELDDLPAVFHLTDDYGEFDVYFPATALCAVDMPLHRLMESAGWEGTLEEPEGDDEVSGTTEADRETSPANRKSEKGNEQEIQKSSC